jgi:hypothetical protein
MSFGRSTSMARASDGSSWARERSLPLIAVPNSCLAGAKEHQARQRV